MTVGAPPGREYPPDAPLDVLAVRARGRPSGGRQPTPPVMRQTMSIAPSSTDGEEGVVSEAISFLGSSRLSPDG
jgi:hypothetical protein